MICLAQITVLLGEGGKASDVDEGSDGGSDVVILRMVVKPLWDVAPNNTNLYLDLPLLWRAFGWVLHPMLGSTTTVRHVSLHV